MRLQAAVLLALTTMLVGFAHRPLELDPRGYGDDFAAYVLPDGTLPALCHYDDAGGHAPLDHRGDGAQAICDACLLSGAPGLGAVAGVVLAPPAAIGFDRLAVGAAARRGSLLHAPTSRGPPSQA